jgi:NAD(P)-dependent dehydrogenase (short-subunit alcohol dehydrogenase family)
MGLLARSKDRLESARAEVEHAGGEAIAVPTDVADYNQVASAARTVEERFGPIDVWVNVAMTTVFAPVVDIEPDEFRRATEVTYLGSVYGTMVALKSMVPRDRGCIVQVGSALAFRSIPLQSAYCGAKHGVVGFVESLRTELLHYRSNVRITMVHLPGMNTPQFSWCRSRLPAHPQPVPPIYQPEVAARAIVWASEHPWRRQVYVGFPTLISIYGNQFFPALIDHYLGKTGFSSQQTQEPLNDRRGDNLFEPVSGQFEAHGAFDHKAHDHSPQVWITKNRAWLSLVLLGIASLAVPMWRARS